MDGAGAISGYIPGSLTGSKTTWVGNWSLLAPLCPVQRHWVVLGSAFAKFQGSSKAWTKPASYCRLRAVPVSLTQRAGWQSCMADVTDIHTGAYLGPDASEAFPVPTGLYNWLCFIPGVKVCHSREQASFGICRELHPSDDAAWSWGGHSPCSWH